jgi:hypothetical protein
MFTVEKVGNFRNFLSLILHHIFGIACRPHPILLFRKKKRRVSFANE